MSNIDHGDLVDVTSQMSSCKSEVIVRVRNEETEYGESIVPIRIDDQGVIIPVIEADNVLVPLHIGSLVR